MLTIAALDAGEDGSYYLQTAPDGPAEYYEKGPAAGRWWGAGATRLGLEGNVVADTFARVLSGADPRSGDMLVSGKAASKDRTPGFDLTFSAPKSVSLLSALSDPEIGRQVREAHAKAVADTMAFIEADVAEVRRGDGGTRHLPAELVAARFEHHSSRAIDPQLHTHVVVANIGYSAEDGRWSALHSRRLYGWAKTGGFVYQAALRAELTQRLGVTWGPVRNGVADVVGFSREQLVAFSTRRQEIETELARFGHTSARAAQLAAWKTRDPKIELPADVLVPRWQARAAEAGITAELVNAMTTGRRRAPTPEQPGDTAERLLGPKGLTEREAVFDRRHALQGVAAAHHGGVAVADTVTLADKVLADPRAVTLPDPTRYGDRRYSTADLLAAEKRVLDGAARRRQAGVAIADPQALADALERRPTLAGEQRHMVETLTRSGAGVQVVVGVGGAGKTFALDAARDAWQSSGVTVVGAALAARAAAELQADSGIPSTTLDGLLIAAQRSGPEGGLPYHGVVVVDEAATVGTRKLDRLLTLAAQYRTAVVLVGDAHQLPEIDAGGSFAALTKVVSTTVLATNRRQQQAWERHALAELRAGDVDTAVTAYRERGRIHVAGDAEAAREHLVADWWAARQAGQDCDMYALRRCDVEDLNRRARVRMAEAGHLKGETVVAGERRYAAGDQVLALRNDRRLRVLNGTRGTVTAVDVDTRSVTVQAGDTTLTLPAEYLDAGHLGHGYATTVHKAQGSTTDQAFLLGSDTLFREAGYTGLSRDRVRSDIYLVAPIPTRRGNSRRPVDAIDRLAAQLHHSRAQQQATPPTSETTDDGERLAHLEDQRERLRRQIGAPPPAPQGDAQHEATLATAAREAAEQRLAAVGRLPRRQRAPAQAQAERDWGDACLRDWKAGHNLQEQEQTRVIWQRWLDDNAEPLARYRQLGEQIDRRHDANETVALADPADYHLQLLGPPPLTGPGRRQWGTAAAAIDDYRQRWNINGPEPFGPQPADPDQARQRGNAQRSIDTARQALSLDRTLDHGMEL